MAIADKYLKECSLKRSEPYYGFIKSIHEGVIDCDLDFVPAEDLRRIAYSLATGSATATQAPSSGGAAAASRGKNGRADATVGRRNASPSPPPTIPTAGSASSPSSMPNYLEANIPLRIVRFSRGLHRDRQHPPVRSSGTESYRKLLTTYGVKGVAGGGGDGGEGVGLGSYAVPAFARGASLKLASGIAASIKQFAGTMLELHLVNVDLDSSGAKRIAEAFLNCNTSPPTSFSGPQSPSSSNSFPSLRVLNLSNNPRLEDAGATAICCTALPTLECLTRLELRGCSLTNGSMRAIAAIFSSNRDKANGRAWKKSLRADGGGKDHSTVSTTGNSNNFVTLANSTSSNRKSTLRYVDLSHNYLGGGSSSQAPGGDGAGVGNFARELLKMLKEDQSIETLILRDNLFTLREIVAFADFFAGDVVAAEQLTELDFTGCSGMEHCEDLAPLVGSCDLSCGSSAYNGGIVSRRGLLLRTHNSKTAQSINAHVKDQPFAFQRGGEARAGRQTHTPNSRSYSAPSGRQAQAVMAKGAANNYYSHYHQQQPHPYGQGQHQDIFFEGRGEGQGGAYPQSASTSLGRNDEPHHSSSLAFAAAAALPKEMAMRRTEAYHAHQNAEGGRSVATMGAPNGNCNVNNSRSKQRERPFNDPVMQPPAPLAAIAIGGKGPSAESFLTGPSSPSYGAVSSAAGAAAVSLGRMEGSSVGGAIYFPASSVSGGGSAPSMGGSNGVNFVEQPMAGIATVTVAAGSNGLIAPPPPLPPPQNATRQQLAEWSHAAHQHYAASVAALAAQQQQAQSIITQQILQQQQQLLLLVGGGRRARAGHYSESPYTPTSKDKNLGGKQKSRKRGDDYEHRQSRRRNTKRAASDNPLFVGGDDNVFGNGIVTTDDREEAMSYTSVSSESTAGKGGRRSTSRHYSSSSPPSSEGSPVSSSPSRSRHQKTTGGRRAATMMSSNARANVDTNNPALVDNTNGPIGLQELLLSRMERDDEDESRATGNENTTQREATTNRADLEAKEGNTTKEVEEDEEEKRLSSHERLQNEYKKLLRDVLSKMEVDDEHKSMEIAQLKSLIEGQEEVIDGLKAQLSRNEKKIETATKENHNKILQLTKVQIGQQTALETRPAPQIILKEVPRTDQEVLMSHLSTEFALLIGQGIKKLETQITKGTSAASGGKGGLVSGGPNASRMPIASPTGGGMLGSATITSLSGASAQKKATATFEEDVANRLAQLGW